MNPRHARGAAIAISTLIMIAPATVLAYKVAAMPSSGPVDEAKLAELDEAVRSAIEGGGHELAGQEQIAAALVKLGIQAVGTQKEADKLGAVMPIQFVVVPTLSPMAGQDRIEIVAYFLPDGRAEMLEKIAIEGELGEVVALMVAQLVTKQGLLGTVQTKPPEPEITNGSGDQPEKVDTKPPPTDEELLAQLEEIDKGAGGGTKEGSGAQAEAKPAVQKASWGQPFKISATVAAGWTILLNDPVRGGAASRHGGRTSVTVAYTVYQKLGIEVGGDIHVFFGASGVGFGLTPSMGMHVGITKRLLAGFRLGLGFFKGATGSQRASFLLRLTPLLEVVAHERVVVRFEIADFSLLAGGDDAHPAIAMLGFSAAIAIRF